MANLSELGDAVVRIADAIDRLALLAEDLAEAMGRADWQGVEEEEK